MTFAGSASGFPGTVCLERPAATELHGVAVRWACRRSSSLLSLRDLGKGHTGEQALRGGVAIIKFV